MEFHDRIFENLKLLNPPEKITVDEWANQFRYLSSVSSAEHGRWRTERTPYLKLIQTIINDPDCDFFVLMFASQTGKSEFLMNIMGYYLDKDPSPILMVQPTLRMCEQFSKERISPMIESTPSIRSKIAEARSRDSGNTILSKKFPGGVLSLASSNSAASLASRAVRILLLDEVDRFEGAGNEGDSVELAIKRTDTFIESRKIIVTSTTTIKGFSKIEELFLKSDQNYYHIPCPHCGVKQILKWSQVRWDENNHKSARYECVHCGGKWSNSQRLNALQKGEWIPEAKFNGIKGFHLAGMYSPWKSLQNAVRDFLKMKDSSETLKVFCNTYWCESWEETGEQVDDTGLFNRREKYDAEIPMGVLLLVAGVDIQDDRLEVEILGIGEKEESWSIRYDVIYGDPSGFQVWQDLEMILRKTYLNAKNHQFHVAATCVDSGGHHTQAVYQFCKRNMKFRVYAIKGSGGFGKPFVNRPTKNNVGRVNLFNLGVDSIKELIYARLKIVMPGNGYCHFPESYDEEYFRQLTAEKIIPRFYKGFKRQEFVKVRSRNEALDCRAYALGAFAILNVRNLEVIARKQTNYTDVTPGEPHPTVPPPMNPFHRRHPISHKRPGGWATNI